MFLFIYFDQFTSVYMYMLSQELQFLMHPQFLYQYCLSLYTDSVQKVLSDGQSADLDQMLCCVWSGSALFA